MRSSRVRSPPLPSVGDRRGDESTVAVFKIGIEACCAHTHDQLLVLRGDLVSRESNKECEESTQGSCVTQRHWIHGLSKTSRGHSIYLDHGVQDLNVLTHTANVADQVRRVHGRVVLEIQDQEEAFSRFKDPVAVSLRIVDKHGG